MNGGGRPPPITLIDGGSGVLASAPNGIRYRVAGQPFLVLFTSSIAANERINHRLDHGRQILRRIAMLLDELIASSLVGGGDERLVFVVEIGCARDKQGHL